MAMGLLWVSRLRLINGYMGLHGALHLRLIKGHVASGVSRLRPINGYGAAGSIAFTPNQWPWGFWDIPFMLNQWLWGCRGHCIYAQSMAMGLLGYPVYT